MKNNNKQIVKYVALHMWYKDIFLCTSKTSLAKHINTSVDTIRRREASESRFYINGWIIYVDVEVNKQPKRNANGFA